jgi:hypothetical protein
MNWTMIMGIAILCACIPKQQEKNIVEYPEPPRYELDMIDVEDLPEAANDTGENNENI